MAPYLATATLGGFDLDISASTACLSTWRSIHALHRERAAAAPGDGRVLRVDLRPVSVHRGRSDRGRREGRGLLARDADEADLRPDAERGDARARALAHVVRRLRDAPAWPDIWLHEGFATWSEWIWSEYQGNKSAAQWFEGLYNTPPQEPLLEPAARRPRHAGVPVQRDDLLPRRDDAAGAPGEDRRLRLLPDHAQLGAENRFGNVSTPQFIALAERISGVDLDLLRGLALPGGSRPPGGGGGAGRDQVRHTGAYTSRHGAQARNGAVRRPRRLDRARRKSPIRRSSAAASTLLRPRLPLHPTHGAR